MTPFLKWPGGKRWLAARHAKLFPASFGCYFEPFLGGGSVFFYLKPTRAVLADTNRELIAAYRIVKRSSKRLEQLLAEHQRQHGEEHYYSVRKTIPSDAVERAARTLYLNRTCFNGMYRVNLAGEFNVPIGTKNAVLLPTDDFAAASRLLKSADLRVSDFEPVIDAAEEGDFVFADPPYIVGHNNNGFVKYNEILFRWSDQTRLADALVRARERGVKVLATNADHAEVRELYSQRGFTFVTVQRYSSISSASASRKQFQELVIRANCSEHSHSVICLPRSRSRRNRSPALARGQ